MRGWKYVKRTAFTLSCVVNIGSYVDWQLDFYLDALGQYPSPFLRAVLTLVKDFQEVSFAHSLCRGS